MHRSRSSVVSNSRLASPWQQRVCLGQQRELHRAVLFVYLSVSNTGLRNCRWQWRGSCAAPFDDLTVVAAAKVVH